MNPQLVNKIISCEGFLYQNSGWNGHQNYDVHDSRDWGPLQINDYWQKDGMAAVGFSFQNWEQTLEYGIRIISTGDLSPWNASRFCWDM